MNHSQLKSDEEFKEEIRLAILLSRQRQGDNIHGEGSSRQAAIIEPDLDIEVDDEQVPIENIRQIFLQYQDYSRVDLVDAVLTRFRFPCDKWLDKTAKLCDMRTRIRWHMTIILCNIPDVLLHHLIIGDIPLQFRQNQHVQELLQKNADKGNKQPGNYVQYLTDSSGLSPTGGELRQLMDVIEIYRQRPRANSPHRRTLFEIDAMFHKKAKETEWQKRIYLQPPKGSSDNYQTHRNVLRSWITAVSERIENLEDNHVLEAPICEVGYAKTPKDRRKEHAKHRSSIYIMNPAEAT